VPYTEAKPALRPESVLPFKVSESSARIAFAPGTGRLWLAPSALAKKALTDTVRGVYLPYWTFDARVGHAMDRRSRSLLLHDGNLRGRRAHADAAGAARALGAGRRPRAGIFFDDDLVCASVGIQPELLRGIEPFPDDGVETLRRRIRRGLDRRALPDRPRGRRGARTRAMDAKLQALCAQQVPGDTFRNLAVHADYSGQTFKHILAPCGSCLTRTAPACSSAQ
jgi:hypothetical protein